MPVCTENLTWGFPSQGAKRIISAWVRLRLPISVSKVQARFRDLVFPRQINLTSGRRAKRLHQYPACSGRGSGGRDHSKLRLFRPWFSAVRLPGSARTDQALEDLWIRSALIVRRLSSR